MTQNKDRQTKCHSNGEYFLLNKSTEHLRIYTCGSCPDNHLGKLNTTRAGWAIVPTYHDPNLNIWQETQHSVGMVVTNFKNYYFLGAKQITNQSAELSAIGQALIYCLRVLRKFPGVIKSITIVSNSEYAMKTLEVTSFAPNGDPLHLFNGEENLRLYTRVRALQTRVEKKIFSRVEYEPLSQHGKNVFTAHATQLARNIAYCDCDSCAQNERQMVFKKREAFELL